MTTERQKRIKTSKRLWCNEHDVYEDECFICHPELKSKVAADVETHKHDHGSAENGSKLKTTVV